MIDPVALTQDLIRCPSVTPEESGALDLLQQVLEGLGFTCHRLRFSDAGTPDVDNLYARLGKAKPNLCFAGHTDVVPPGPVERWSSDPFSGEIRDGIVHGRGAADMKGAIACWTVPRCLVPPAFIRTLEFLREILDLFPGTAVESIEFGVLGDSSPQVLLCSPPSRDQ